MVDLFYNRKVETAEEEKAAEENAEEGQEGAEKEGEAD